MNETKQISVKTSTGDRLYTLYKWSAFDGAYIQDAYHLYSINFNERTESMINNHKSATLTIMNYVSVNINGNEMKLSTEALANNHIPDWQALTSIISNSIEFNTYPLD